LLQLHYAPFVSEHAACAVLEPLLALLLLLLLLLQL
jgi:hypothetical protein